MNSNKSFSVGVSKYLIVVLISSLLLFANVLPAQASTLDDMMVTLKSLQVTLQSLVSGKVLGVSTGAYQYVLPSDVGVSIGTGVVAAVPTTVYTGPLYITSPTTIQNVVINGCIEVAANNVTLRNVKINCNSWYGVKVAGGVSDFILEYSQLVCTTFGKQIYFENGGPNAKIRYNETSGCESFFTLNGNLQGVEVLYNYMHHPNINVDSHADGFQIGESLRTYGAMLVKGNNFQVNKTDEIGRAHV